MTFLNAGVNSPCGLVRVLHKEYDTAASDHPAISFFGLYSQMQTAASLGANTYAVRLDPGLSSTDVQLFKTSLNNVFIDLGGIGGVVHWPHGMVRPFVYAIEFKWQTDPISGSILLEAFADPTPVSDPDTYDWSTLEPVVSYTDGASPYHTGVTAGWFGTSSGPTRKNYYDKVDIFTN